MLKNAVALRAMLVVSLIFATIQLPLGHQAIKSDRVLNGTSVSPRLGGSTKLNNKEVERRSSLNTAAPQLGKQSVKEVVAAMTTEEKVKLLVGMGMKIDDAPELRPSEEDGKIPEKVPGAAGRTHAIPRLGIPSLTLSDGPAGIRIDPIRNNDKSKTYYATGFPIATLLASSWDTSLMNRVGVAFGNEARDYGIDIILAPAMNIQRNPLGGRNFEYYSEDPVISGNMAAAFVSGVQSRGVGTSIKHFAVNNQEFNRMQSDSVLSERALREIYLRGFEIAVKEAQPWTVMSSYNLINGTYASESRELLTTLLRDEWGFKGFVMSDWFGGIDAVAQMKAGNDLVMPGLEIQQRAILKAIKDGVLSEEQLNQNVERVLNILLLSPVIKNRSYSDQPDLKTNAQIAREAATEGMVLLKNNNTLPIKPQAKVALFGIASYDLIAGGTGSGDVNKEYVVGLDEGMMAAKFALNDELSKTYKKFVAEEKVKRKKPLPFMPLDPLGEMPLDQDSLQQLASESDVAVFTLSRNSGEFADLKVEGNFHLKTLEREVIENVARAFHAKGKKVVIVLNIGAPIETPSWRDKVDAILVAWQPGQEGGNAITDVLSGKVSPSGKLATTFPASYSDVPSAKSFPGRETGAESLAPWNPYAGKPSEALYDEGIYVGYRYHNTFNVKPAYEFGYGLSYTTFSFNDFKLSANKFQDKVAATVTVKNTGNVPGKEVVEIYINAPKKKLQKPVRELKAFAKTRLLQPGESQTLTFIISPRDLSLFDTGRSAWIAESGTYRIEVGRSSLIIARSAALELDKDLVVQKVKQLLAPKKEIRELEPIR